MMPSSYFFRKLRLLFSRKKFRDELNEEMEFHRAAAERAFIEDGMTHEAARDAARRQFGNTTRLEERSHEAIAFQTETLLQDMRYALRQLRRNPAFTLTAILILALGMGANLAIFAFVDAALIKPLPYRDPARLVGLYEAISAGPKYCISYLDYLDWKRWNKSFQSMDVYTSWNFVLRAPEGTELAQGAHVSWGFFRTLGVAPMLGRDFLPAEETTGAAASRTVILSYASWQKRFGGRKDILGQTVTLDGAVKTIVGVMPRDFHFAPVEPVEFWDTIDPADSCSKRRICHNLFGIARLKDGVTVANALDDVTALARQLEKQYPDSNQGQGAAVFPLTDVVVGDAQPVLRMLLAASALLLLIAAVNVANLLLVRSENRRREIALREALGASTLRIVRQLVTEGALLVGMGSILAVGIAVPAVNRLPRLLPADMLAGMPFLSEAGFSLYVGIYAAAVVLIAWTLFALVPLVRLPLREVRSSLSDGGRTMASGAWRRLGSSLVVLELATAMLLLAGAGLLTRSLYRLLHEEIGIRTDHLATISIAGSPALYRTDDLAIALEKEVIRRMQALPGARSAAVASYLPLSGNGPFSDFVVKGQPLPPGSHDEATRREITPGYFDTIGAQMVRGRTFTEDDGLKQHVAIINEAMAQKFFAGQDPIGRQIQYTGSSGLTLEIVGIARNIKEGPLDDLTRPAFYIPFAQDPGPFFSVVVRTSQDAQSLLPLMTRAAHEVDPHLVVFGEKTMENSMQASQTAYIHRVAAWLAGGFAAMALLLGVVGLYGVVAYSVSQRTREIGVRMALGAQRGTVYKLILIEASRLIAVGVGLGIAGSLATTSLLRPLLFGVRPMDLPTLAAVAAVLAAAAILASYLPARRAASVNPVEALRAE
jgi:macrolide transport system ATP-binding/permease protein